MTAVRVILFNGPPADPTRTTISDQTLNAPDPVAFPLTVAAPGLIAEPWFEISIVEDPEPPLCGTANLEYSYAAKCHRDQYHTGRHRAFAVGHTTPVFWA